MSSETKGQKVTRLSPIRRDQLLNRLNGQHFQNIPLLVCLRHRTHGHVIRVQARPQMALDEHATATWVKDCTFPPTLNIFELTSIILAGSRRAFEFTPERHWIDEEAIRFTIPERAEEFRARKHLRYNCHEQNLEITVSQNTLAFRGQLLDYSVAGMLVELTASDQQNLTWVNPTIPAQLTIEYEGALVYSGQAEIQEKPDPVDSF